MIDTNSIQVQTIDRILKKRLYSVECKIPIDSLRFDWMVQDILTPAAHDLIIRLNAMIYSEQMSTRYIDAEYEVPDTWFQLLKRDHAPQWFLDIFPVKMKKVSHSVKAEFSVLYPNFKAPNNMSYQIIREVDEPSFGYTEHP